MQPDHSNERGLLVQMRGPDAPTNFPASEYVDTIVAAEAAEEPELRGGANLERNAAHLSNLPDGVVRSITIPQRQLSQVMSAPLSMLCVERRSSSSLQGHCVGPCLGRTLHLREEHGSVSAGLCQFPSSWM